MALPQCVIDARKIDFGVQITGYLCCAEFEPPCVVGSFYTVVVSPSMALQKRFGKQRLQPSEFSR
jgi:hypothetical protein